MPIGFDKLSNPHVYELLARTERRNAFLSENLPTKDPGEIGDKASATKYITALVIDRRNMEHELDLMKRERAKLNRAAKDGESAPDRPLKSFIDTEIEKELRGRKTANERGETSLTSFLKENPEAGELMGAKATAYRLKAQIANHDANISAYNTLLKNLPDYKSEGTFSKTDRFAVFMKNSGHKLIWWIRDHPVAGGGSTVALIIMAKLAAVLLFLDVIEGGHKKKKQQVALPASPPPPRALPSYAPSQPAYAAQYAGPQASSAYPTPLQTALNMA